LSSFSEKEAVVASIVAGAAGYLLKQNDPDKLVQAVRKVAAGGSLLDPAVVDAALVAIRRNAQESSGDPMSRLSDQEGRVLRLIAEGKTNREIARMLVLSENTVRTYVSSIFQKLQITRRAEAAAIATRHGQSN